MRVAGTLFDPALSAGGAEPQPVNVSAAYVMNAYDNFVRANATSAAFAVTLPPITQVPLGTIVVVKKTEASANAVTVTASTLGGADLIDGATTSVIAGGSRGVLRLRASAALTWDIW